ncbi:hypothetical protein NIES4072_49950 [Nostoc commune NIES-4072]|uniref:Uncharacterized protein n=1 Tax=Nostoc commune NIES-4072 TaxID=2005467 RepID=A0A2R5FZP2_NOSCO|nr:hypothetical protein [Nostoc commune]BBD67707.1 hypothetical protein NIES4070_41000 [Nostoc commune HK-02]GBG21311.1 hypothetical protein NIES4072_49950 [Nostoc commune NIES-4072]
MKYLILLAVALLAWIAFIYSHKVSSITQMPTFFMNSMFKVFNQNSNETIQIKQIKLSSEIRENLYNSISTGMSYDEVRSILGWDGILIYENNIDSADGQIHEKIYQWNDQDVYLTDYESQRRDINPYWSVTLRFQNDILINKASFNLQN